LEWFFKGGGSVTKSDEKAKDVYDLGYVYGEITAEDSNHGSPEVAGLACAYSSYICGNYGIIVD
jgi:hypothetical protein